MSKHNCWLYIKYLFNTVDFEYPFTTTLSVKSDKKSFN